MFILVCVYYSDDDDAISIFWQKCVFYISISKHWYSPGHNVDSRYVLHLQKVAVYVTINRFLRFTFLFKEVSNSSFGHNSVLSNFVSTDTRHSQLEGVILNWEHNSVRLASRQVCLGWHFHSDHWMIREGQDTVGGVCKKPCWPAMRNKPISTVVPWLLRSPAPSILPGLPALTSLSDREPESHKLKYPPPQ